MSQTLSNRYIRRICLALLIAALAACSSNTDPGPTPSPDPDPTETELPLADLVTEAISIELNPHGIAPLVAEASFTTRIPTRITLTVPGEESVTQSFGEATEHRLPILGLYPDTNNQVTLRLESTEGYTETTESIQTEALPEALPDVDIVTAKRDQMEPGWNLSALRVSDTPGRHLPFIYDPAGDIRWYAEFPFAELAIGFERLANGNFIFGVEETIYEYDMLGAEINAWQLPDYFYTHDIIEKPDGNFVIVVDKEGLDTIDDFVIEMDRDSGEIVREWDLRQVLDVSRQTYEEEVRDWLHVNAVWYDERDDTLIISGRNQGVFKVTMENELVWILAPHKGWEQAGPDGNGLETSQYLLTAVDANGNPYPEAVQQGDEDPEGFSWVWGQHTPMVLPNGNLFVFDNGRKRNFSGSGTARYSRGVEYAIDKEAMTIEQVWQYGKERGEEFHAQIISDVDYLPETGNRLIMPGIINASGTPPNQAIMTEVTYPGKEVVFEAKIEFANLFAGEVFGYKDISYRSERLPLYPSE